MPSLSTLYRTIGILPLSHYNTVEHAHLPEMEVRVVPDELVDVVVNRYYDLTRRHGSEIAGAMAVHMMYHRALSNCPLANLTPVTLNAEDELDDDYDWPHPPPPLGTPTEPPALMSRADYALGAVGDDVPGFWDEVAEENCSQSSDDMDTTSD